jgi:Holliday junction DNA helicase RuvA
MIRSLAGTVISIDDETICLDVAGFGLEVFASGSLMESAAVGEFLRCSAFLQVSDAGMAIFGFSDDVERSLFLEITQVKTMGGKLSIGLLRNLDAGTIVSAILSSDAPRLMVPGLGAKRAERICFELSSRVEKKFAALGSGDGALSHSGGFADRNVMEGLVSLGFSRSEALGALASCRAESPDSELSEEKLMKSALAKLQRR